MRRYDGWFRLARDLRVPVEECMEGHTERQMLLWHLSSREDMDVPDRGDFYLMQLSAEVRLLREQVACMFGGKGRDVKIADFKMTFSSSEDVKQLSRERTAEIAKQAWSAGLGPEIVHKTRTRTEARALGLID